MLGQDLCAALVERGHDVVAAPRSALDVTQPAECLDAVKGVDVVVNLAAWTDVDGAESSEGAAFAVNGVGAANVARACRLGSARLVHLSTDYVFAGTARRPYPEDHPLAPASAYGRTKAAGEWAVRAEGADAVVVRTAWLYGRHGRSFVATMAGLARRGGEVSVVDDQIGQPTTTTDLSRFVGDLLEADAPAGLYHGTSEGETTWYGLARAVFEELGEDSDRVRPTTTAAYPRPAPRPAYSVLGHDETRAAGLRPLPHWREALRTAFPHLAVQG